MLELCAKPFDVAKIADSGQCFRLWRTGEASFRMIALGKCVSLQQTLGGCRLDCNPADAAVWRDYFDIDTDYAAFAHAVDAQDAFLTQSVQCATGIRILRQDAFEMLITFLISQRKNIPAIRQAVETLCAQCACPAENAAPGEYAFPSPEAMAALPDSAWDACRLGYRTPYVREAARRIAGGECNLQQLADADDETLREALLALPGVGPKVAACVMLFGFHRLNAFPVDVWINRALEESYPQGFPLELYAGYAGVLQQYIFYAMRKTSHKISDSAPAL